MGKRISIAVLWGFAVWTWVSMAQVFLGLPNIGMLAGFVITAAIVFRGIVSARTSAPTVESGSSLVSQRS
jgi:hypothetical protein